MKVKPEIDGRILAEHVSHYVTQQVVHGVHGAVEFFADWTPEEVGRLEKNVADLIFKALECEYENYTIKETFKK